MKVNLGGIVHLSTIDWPGKACMVIFLRGCPLRCPHCQNRSLWKGENPVEMALIRNEMKKAIAFCGKTDQITLEESISRTKAKPLIGALVLSGGEPLMQAEQAMALLGTAKSLGLSTGIETSGYYPDRLSVLLNKGIVDKVFLDIKAAMKEPDYARATGRSDISGSVLESLRLCMRSGVPLEVRTTVFPEMPSFADVGEIAETLQALMDAFPDNQLDGMVIQQGIPRDNEFAPVLWEEIDALARRIGGCPDGIEVRIKAAPRAKLDKVDSSGGLLIDDGRASE